MADVDREFALLCPHCGEQNPPEFPACWSCHGALPARENAAAVMPARAGEPALDPGRRKHILVQLAVALTVVWLPGVAGGIWELVEPASAMGVGDVLFDLGVVAGLVALILYFGWLDGDWRRRFGLTRPHLGKEALWAGITWLAMVLAHTLAVVVGDRLGLPDGGTRPGFTAEAVWLVPLYFLALAFLEELFYRAYLFDRLTELTRRPMLAITISALFFSAAHVYPALGTVSIFFTGVALGWIFWTRRSLWSLVLGHALLNVWIEFR